MPIDSSAAAVILGAVGPKSTDPHIMADDTRSWSAPASSGVKARPIDGFTRRTLNKSWGMCTPFTLSGDGRR